MAGVFLVLPYLTDQLIKNGGTPFSAATSNGPTHKKVAALALVLPLSAVQLIKNGGTYFSAATFSDPTHKKWRHSP
ncbi:hypothetical protein [Metabacillus idriensis]|uniref:hypothetical protein n=1 Tax=Metabacillus idriensis TaxID=324768 RepID=UPI003D26BEAC